MNHEQFIEPKTAELAKQAGFDWKCWAYWLSDYANGELEQKAPFENRAVPYDYNTEPGAKYKKGNMLSAPTQSVLQRWLREVHNLIIIVKPYSNGKEVLLGYTIYQEVEGYIRNTEDGIVDHSYESTLEADYRKEVSNERSNHCNQTQPADSARP